MRNSDNPLANPAVVLREEFDDSTVLFNPDSGRGFGLNPTGVLVWKLMDGEHTIDALIEEIRQYAEGVANEAGNDLRAFVDSAPCRGAYWARISTSRIRKNCTRKTLPGFVLSAKTKQKAVRTNPLG